MATRDLFPREADRAVILDFLTRDRAGEFHPDYSVESSITLLRAAGRLKIMHYTGGEGVSALHSCGDLAWYGPDRSIQAKLMPGIDTLNCVRAINFMLETLGCSERVEREKTDGVFSATRFTFNGAYLDVDQAFTLIGPLGLQAYRASAMLGASVP